MSLFNSKNFSFTCIYIYVRAHVITTVQISTDTVLVHVQKHVDVYLCTRVQGKNTVMLGLVNSTV